MRAVAGLVGGLARGGVEHVCLNKTGVEQVQGGLGLLLAALHGAGSASADVAPSDEEQWPLLELSEVRVPACACGGRPPTACCRCNRGATEVQQRCNRGATEAQQRRNRGA